MDTSYDFIRKVGKDYFDSVFMESFIQLIDKWAANARKSFFQLMQKNNQPTLEFACVSGQAIVDVMKSHDLTGVMVGRVSAFKYVVLKESLNTTHVQLFSDGQHDVSPFYLAVTEEYRGKLREYGAFLQSLMEQ